MIKRFLAGLAMTGMICSVCAKGFTKPDIVENNLRSSVTTRDPAPRDAKADLEIVRKRILADLLEPAVDVKHVNELLKTIRPDSTWPGINYKDVSRTGFEHRIHLENMLELARAFRKEGSPFYQQQVVKKTVSTALDFWISHDFICDNWWWNEMGTPNLMINTLLLMDPDLTDKERKEGARISNRANLEASGARPGGDLIVIAGMLGKQGLFARNEAVLQRVVKVMADQIKIATVRGINPDMGFHHRVDNVTSIHTYGTAYANAFAYWAVKITNTSFTLPEPAMKLLIDYYLDGICKSMAFGMYADLGARNRDLSRQGALAPVGAETPENLMKASSYRKSELEAIVRTRNHQQKLTETSNRFFWYSEYFAHQRPAYYSSVRMFSTRNHNVEDPHNEEGLRNHHFADGSNFLTRTGKEYYNIFPVWDWFKIPGATILQSPTLPPSKEMAKKGLTEFVGGVSDGSFGTAAFDFTSPHDPLRARKAWFFFDREYVCLGAGITSEAAYPVATTLNQCLLNKEVIVKTVGIPAKQPTGLHDLKAVSWVFHDSVAYIFPTPADVHLQNANATGNWRMITHQAWATEAPVNMDVFKLWLDHGTKPVSAGYSYMVVPDISAAAIEPFRKLAEVSILANTAELQAVRHNRLNQAQVVFYKAGSIKISNSLDVSADQACLLIIHTDGRTVSKLAVSDPTHKLTTLHVEISGHISGSPSSAHTTYDEVKKRTTIQVDLPKDLEAGKSLVMVF